jgi:hypothetical protein
MNLTELFDRSQLMAMKAEIKSLVSSISPSVEFDFGLKDADGDLYLTLSLIRLPKEERQNGLGSRVMGAVCSYCDNHHIIMACSPTSEFGTPIVTLMNFYKSFGFVNNSGRSRNHNVMETMIRYPKQ